MTRMFREGIPPTYETLSKMMRTENVSLSWLLGANCPAYLYTATTDDESTADELQMRITEESGWRIHLVTDGAACALVLTQTATLEDTKRKLVYTAVEVICGPAGKHTAAIISMAPAKLVGQLVRVGGDQMRQIYREGLGTFQLIGGAGVPGLLETAESERLAPEMLARLRGDATWTVLAREALPHTLERLQGVWGKFSDTERQAIGVVVEPLIALAEHRLDPIAASTAG